MRAWIDTINAGDIGALERAVDKYYATDYVLHDPSVPNFSGGAATVKKLIRESVQTLPDAEIVIENLIAEGDVVAIRQTVTGTQPDGQPLTFSVMSILRFADGRIAEEWELVAPLGEEVVGSDIGGD
jgi:predicted SnoaL-like aldol condensation-catalyzing enzyme